MKYHISSGQESWEVEVRENSDGEFEIQLNGKKYTAQMDQLRGQISLFLDGRSLLVSAQSGKKNRQVLRLGGRSYPLKIRGEHQEDGPELLVVHGLYKEVCPMPGLIKEIRRKPDSSVEEGETLVVLEAMKMEIEIKAQCGGKVEGIFVQCGASVSEGDPLFQIRVKD